MKILKTVFRYGFSIYGFLVFLILMFMLLPFIIIASFFGKVKGGNIIYVLIRFWARTCLFFWCMRHKNIFEAPHQPDHPCIFVFNHISYIDIPILLCTFRYQHIRVLGKAEMKKVPVFGFIYKNAVVTVDRGDATHRAKSVYILKSVLKKNISVVIAPEGTFNMTHRPLKEFYDGAFKIAIETQTPIKPVLILNAYDRLNYNSIFSLSPGKSTSVYLEEVSVESFESSDVAQLKQKVFSRMEAGLIKYKASWIKNEESKRNSI